MGDRNLRSSVKAQSLRFSVAANVRGWRIIRMASAFEQSAAQSSVIGVTLRDEYIQTRFQAGRCH